MAANYVVPADYGGSLKLKKITCSGLVVTGAGVLGNTGFTLPAGAVVVGGWIDVTTVETTGSTKTMNIGTTGALTNMGSGLSVASATQVKFSGTFPLMNLEAKEILISSIGNAHTEAVVDVYIEYFEQ
jgi:hypothetical protein